MTAAGFTPVEAVLWATMAPADGLGWSELGRLVPGAVADLVLLDIQLTPAAAFIPGRLDWDRDPGRRPAWRAAHIAGCSQITQHAGALGFRRIAFPG